MQVVQTKQTRTQDNTLIEANHKLYDHLIHEISENSFIEIVRDSSVNKVNQVIIWTNSDKTKKIRENIVTRDKNNKIISVVTKQYDSAGVLIIGETSTENISRNDNNKVETISMVVT